MADLMSSSSKYKPREKFLQAGPSSLSDSDLLAIVLGSGTKNKKVKALADEIIDTFGNNLLHATPQKLTQVKGIGKAKALQIVAAISLFNRLLKSKNKKHASDLYLNGLQNSLLEFNGVDSLGNDVNKKTISLNIQSRRFLGNKYKLLGFIEDIVKEKCSGFTSFCDIFAGTGVVGARFNKANIKIITNDILYSNFVPLKTFLGVKMLNKKKLLEKIEFLNDLKPKNDNYFSSNFGNTYFTQDNAKKIGAIREKINKIAEDEEEKSALITSLLYATDRIANTVGHYDAFRKTLDNIKPIKLLLPEIQIENNFLNEIYQEDANELVKKVEADILYIDPPYNSRQYSDAYHLLENLALWQKPEVHGVAKKMDRTHLKSKYSLKNAAQAFRELIENAQCKHILMSYNNTGESKDGRSNARITDEEIMDILNKKGTVEIYEKEYKAFTTGKSNGIGHTERIFYCEVKN